MSRAHEIPLTFFLLPRYPLLLPQTLSCIKPFIHRAIHPSQHITRKILAQAYTSPSIMGLQRPVYKSHMRPDSRYPHVLHRRGRSDINQTCDQIPAIPTFCTGEAPDRRRGARLGAIRHAHTSPFPAISPVNPVIPPVFPRRDKSRRIITRRRHDRT